MILDSINHIYKNARILVTGHSGFGGIWLCNWLSMLGADVLGYSNELISERNPFTHDYLNRAIKEVKGDIRDRERIRQIFLDYQPTMVFHLAAQAIVIYSYQNPEETFATNVNGTLNILDAICETKSVRVLIAVTTDKVYKDQGNKIYAENDLLGGNDPYSASKAMCELAIEAYQNSWFNSSHTKEAASVRAGNWIGGGDFSKYRLMPDIVRSLMNSEPIILRNPNFVRPWQYILDSLFGFLILGAKMSSDANRYSGAWNFGSSEYSSITCNEIVNKTLAIWCSKGAQILKSEPDYEETKHLRISSKKAKDLLNWAPLYSIDETLECTMIWYKEYHARKSSGIQFDMSDVYENQIRKFMNDLKVRNVFFWSHI